MNHEDCHSKELALRLVSEIKQRAKGLQEVLWSQEELMANKEYLDASSQKIDSTIDLIMKNFNWYQKVGWKKFIADRDDMEHQMAEKSAQQEKERFHDWLTEFEAGLNFYRGFHQQVPQDTILEKITRHAKVTMTEQFVLDVGCRDGLWLRKFRDLGAAPKRLAGIEPNGDLWQSATEALQSGSVIFQGYPDWLPFPTQQFNVVLAFGIFMHVLDEHLQRKIASELVRVLSPDGIILIADADQRLLDKQEPYVAYASQVLSAYSLQSWFPDCDIEMDSLGEISLVMVTQRCNRTEG